MKRPSDAEKQTWTIAEIVKWTTDYFTERDIDSPRLTAEYLLSHVLGLTRMDLYLQFDKPLLKEELSEFKTLIRRRADHEPLAYITGSKGFWSLDLSVSERVLIPRPDTECIVEEVLKKIDENMKRRPLSIVDLGTGSGAIILSLASEHPENCYFAVDISPDALKIAKKNAGLNCPDSRIDFLNGDWLSPFSRNCQFDIIVSNPPYIPTGDIPHLQPEITKYEPVLALDGDTDGLRCIRHIIKNAKDYLKPGGWLFIETGFDQKEKVTEIAIDTGFYSNIQYIKDLGGNNRVVKMKKINS